VIGFYVPLVVMEDDGPRLHFRCSRAQALRRWPGGALPPRLLRRGIFRAARCV